MKRYKRTTIYSSTSVKCSVAVQTGEVDLAEKSNFSSGRHKRGIGG